MTLQETKEFIKCAKDPVYFMDTYGYIFDITKNTVGKLTLFDFQVNMVSSFQNNKNNIVLKSRQMGMSVITSGYVCWKLLFSENERILIVANDGNGARRFLDSARQFLNYLPKFLLPDEIIKNNTQEIVFSNGSFCKAVASGKNAGRGETLTLLVLDETAFIENCDEIWMAAGVALSSKDAKCIMISTPFGTGNLYHSMWTGAEKGENDFVRTKIHWTQHPFYSIGSYTAKNEWGQEYISSPWYEKQCEKFKWDRVKISQEFDLSFEGSASVVIDGHIIDRYEKDIEARDVRPVAYFDYKETVDKFVKRDGVFPVWEMPREKGNYIISCLPEGESVLTNSGLKNIENVNFDDFLIDKDGNRVKIKNIQKTINFNDFVYDIKLSNVYRRTKFTSNHPILSSTSYKLKRNYDINNFQHKFRKRYWDIDFDFVNAEDIKVNDWLPFPNIYKNNTLSNEEIIEKWEPYKNIGRVDFFINNPLLDSEFWWFVGIWLAEGWTIKNKNSYYISTAHNINESHYVDRIKKIFEKYDRSVCQTKITKDNTVKTTFTSQQIYYFLNDNFGAKAGGKYISEWVKFLPEEYKLSIVNGYLNGDGCWFKTSRNHSKMTFVSISLKLLEGIQDILFSVGIISGLQLLRGEGIASFKRDGIIRTYKTKKTYELNLHHYDSILLANMLKLKHDYLINSKRQRQIDECFFSSDLNTIFFRVKKVNTHLFQGNVYNFETETHTFLCRNIITHNCDVAGGYGADYSTIQVIDADNLVQVAEYQGKVKPDIFAEIICEAGKAYNNGYIVVEGNNQGIATTLTLKKYLQYPLERIYHSKSIKKIYVRHAGVEFVDVNEAIAGFQTSVRTRPLLMNALTKYMRDGQIKINSRKLLTEFRTFVYTENDKAEHSKGYHDDLIMALAIGLFIRDTEFDNVFQSKAFIKAMIDSFSYSVKGTGVHANIQAEVSKNTSRQAGGDDDVSWLLGPMRG